MKSIKEIKLELSKEFLTFLQKKAKQENKSLNNYIATTLMQETGYTIPNNTTIKSIEEVENNPENLTKVNNVRIYFEKFKNNL